MPFRLISVFLVLLLAACQSLPPPARSSAALPESVAAEATLPASAPRFDVDTSASEIRLLVYRAGRLAEVGHNHVVTGTVRGEIRAGETAAGSGFRLEVPVDSLSVDDPATRREEGEAFAADVSRGAREGTRENMLGPDVLDSEHYPVIRIDSVSLTGPRWNPTVVARTTLHGKTRDLRFPAAVVQHGDELTVIADFTILQSDFGIRPFAVLGGGLKVRDAVDIRILIVARRED